MLKTFLACLFCFPNSDRMVFSWPCEAKKAIKFHHFGEIAKANCLRRYFVKKMFSCVWSRLTCSHTCSTSFNRLFIKLPPLCKSCEIIKVDINYNLYTTVQETHVNSTCNQRNITSTIFNEQEERKSGSTNRGCWTLKWDGSRLQLFSQTPSRETLRKEWETSSHYYYLD